jgi:hypothetical protein
MSKHKSTIIRFRPDLITDLPEKIWNDIGSYEDQEWDLPEDKKLLAKIVGEQATDELYAISDSAERNIHLRSLLSKPLKDKNLDIRLAAIEWVVYDWGNVRGKSEKHEKWPEQLKNYKPDVIEDFISANYRDRIASWSKVLGFADCNTYAIYDARVAMSLNTILDNTGYKNRFYMPPPSSTKLKTLFSNIKKHVGEQYSGKQPAYLGYFDYMDLLNAVVEKKLAKNVLEVEMRLFAHGMTFAKKYADKHNLPY